jgi:transposase InsO family protein
MLIWWAHSSTVIVLITIIDRMSKWMEAIPLSETSAAACAKALTFTWISRFGVPETITSDCGPQFTSNLWFHLCKMLNISHKQTIAYHPESNGAVERLHRRLKDALPARAAVATCRGVTLCAPWTQSTADGRHWSLSS